MKLITFATFEEAKQTLRALSAKPLENGIYQAEDLLVAITGIGPFATYVMLQTLSDRVTSILNIGVAGSLNKELEVGSIHPIRRCSKHLWLPQGSKRTEFATTSTFDDILLKQAGLHLCTLDFPLYAKAADIAPGVDLIDMEGYANAYAARSFGIPCQMYKLVSDYCTEHSSKEIKKRLDEFSQALADFVTVQKEA